MIAKIYSAIPRGFNGRLVEVEGDTNLGLPAFNIVGMGSKTIFEARERIRSAIANSNLTFPNKKITINLAPADLAKDGTYLDLPMALSILMIAGQIKASDIDHRLFVGELSLDGKTRPVRGIINIVEVARKYHFKEIYVPQENLAQASLIPNVKITGITSLLDLFLQLKQYSNITNNIIQINRDSNVVPTTKHPFPISSVVNSTTHDVCTIVNPTADNTFTHQPHVVKNTTNKNSSKNVVDSTITDSDIQYLLQNDVKNTTINKNSASTQQTTLPNSTPEFANSKNNSVISTNELQKPSKTNILDTLQIQSNTTHNIATSSDATSPLVKNTQTGINQVLLDDIVDQSLAKRALAIAVAGRHNILLAGPPGTGKSMLAHAAANLLPDPLTEEIIAITKLHSLHGYSENVFSTRPFRAPHHTASTASIIGGGNSSLPGEISLAHCGILFLDEIPEYNRNVLEALRQPLENKTITITRADSRVTYPANFMLIATMNPCPCGYLGDDHHECICTTNQIRNYQKKISGPILDRIDIIITVNRPNVQNYLHNNINSSSEHLHVKNTITEVTKRQYLRYQQTDIYNSSLTPNQINQYLKISDTAHNLLNHAAIKLNLSGRSYYKIIKVAQTIADLEQCSSINNHHISEALTFRQKPNQL